MSQPCIISVAITGSVPRKKDNPAVPITISEQIESTHEAYEAGASLVHLHVRDEQENSSSDRSSFAALQDGIRKHCPDIIIQFSTGGRGRSFEQRGAMLDLRPDMASLATGSVNFPTTVYENPPDFVRSLAKMMLDYDVKPEIEIFDLAMLYSTVDLVQQELLKSPVHVQFVMGVKNALPARREILEFEVQQLKALLPDATWTAAGIGRHQLEVNHWTLQMGGHCRTGLEDNVRWDKETLAKSNAQLVTRVASLCGEYGRPVASAAKAREMLGLPAR
ncbi:MULTISPECIES: 3-keto-5-aminohexanoate cleavage protein [Paraburkholderia]|uniref:3-keto-5-aminohexanoate cleavage protein n=1 Tax=Paraburkholderia madseniana TaxID=2599607 RepID=A0A6N6W752_9BURK|nr:MULTISPECIES: 3-keto-5-aminohexanoate cleavage protein [Paraburkholderia]KAE8756051.1 3-keto-5-aminohexanoate cleavage protein [Paraburkholderia madseniana]MCX4177593.1 3-keto-5-aminohexanoate cleavage protein [Paraburkholderia madseniana]MDQ6465582.1 3-keto-5-aminohexanoate cleavage protein [Paraburkholderia madseniana]